MLYPPDGSLRERFLSAGLEVENFELRGKWDLGAIGRLASTFRRHRPKVVHCQGGPALDLFVVLAARLAGIRPIVTRPVMIEDTASYRRWDRTANNLIDILFCLPLAHRIVAVSRDGLHRLKRRTLGERVVHIPNGVDLARFGLTRAFSAHDGRAGAVQIGMVGHLLPYKGWFDFLEVAKSVTQQGLSAHWHIVGDGSERESLEAQVALLGLQDRITFHGLLQDVRPVLAQLDIFLFTSHREGLSVAVLEAMASGLPVVATDVGGVAEQVLDAETGYVLAKGDVEGLTRRCVELITEPDRRMAMGRKGEALTASRYSEQAMQDSYAALYRAAAEGVS